MSIKGYTQNQHSCNFYVYAGNDGVNYVDLDGFEKKLNGTCGLSYNSINWKLNNLDYDAMMILQKYFCKGRIENKEFFAWMIYNDNGEAIERGFGSYLSTTLGKMLYIEYNPITNTLYGKRFPDLDLSKCICPNTKEYKGKCGGYK
jgi:hypothetical protein